jgi:anti-anti-sigma factor
MEMKVVEETEDLTYVALVGRMDVGGVEQIETRFVAYTTSRSKPVIVDISQVPFMASIGMRVILRVVKALKPIGAKLVVLKPQPLVEEALRIACLDQVFGIAQDEQKAREFLQSA